MNKWVAIANNSVVAVADSKKEAKEIADSEPDVLLPFICQVGGALREVRRKRRIRGYYRYSFYH